jgi:hypothetical protein
MTAARKRVRGGAETPDGDYSQELLERLARILQLTGHSPKALARQFAEICRKLDEPTQRWDPSSRLLVADLAHVTAHWYADPEYLDARGAPRALPRRGNGPSLRTLVEKVLPGREADAVIDSLVEVHAISRHGVLYRPTGKSLTYSRHRVSARLQGLSALLAILRTVEHNTSHPVGLRLFERAAINPRFPVRQLPETYRRLKSRADSFLWQTDGDMRQIELPDESKDTTRLCVGVYISEDPPATGAELRAREPPRVRRSARTRRRGSALPRASSGRRGRP